MKVKGKCIGVLLTLIIAGLLGFVYKFTSMYDFEKVRGTAAGVSYNRITREPEPQFFFQRWTIFER